MLHLLVCRGRLRVDSDGVHQRVHTQRELRAGARDQHRGAGKGQHEGVRVEHHGAGHRDAQHDERGEDQDVAGGVGVGEERPVLEYSGVGGAGADRDRPVLLRQEDLHEPDGGGGAVGDQLRQHKGDVHGEAGALLVQRQRAVHGGDAHEHTAEAAAGGIPHV